MKLRTLGMALTLAVAGGAVLAPAAHADHFNRYFGYRYYSGRDSGEIHRREIMRSRLIDLGDRVREADRHDLVGRRDAERLFERLDDLREFLRHDHYLGHDEFRAWMRKLDRVEDDFRAARRHERFEDRDDREDRGDRDDRD